MDAKASPRSTIIATGFAMFSMFFGAGNVVFPLALGRMAGDQNIFAITGLLLTGVGVPFLGLIAMTLFNGNYQHFFERIGKVPGFTVALFIMGLIGPFGATPRTIALSFSTINHYWSGTNLPIFSLIACLIIFAFTYSRSKIIDILGYFLTPILLASLTVIVVKGILTSPSAPASDLDSLSVFFTGLTEGYQTMDLLGAFFFSSVVISCLEGDRDPKEHKNYRQVIFTTLKASLIGATLLAMVYGGFSFLAARYSASLQGVPSDQILAVLSLEILGPYAGIVAILAVSLACLTTAIALVSVFAEFLHQDIFQDKISYHPCLVLTLVVTYFVSILSFQQIMLFLIPILQVCYPALIVLSVLNIAHKLHHIQSVKIPVLITLLISLIAFFM